MDSPCGGSVVRTATTTSNKPRQRGHAIATFSLATTYFYSIYLLDAIVTSLLSFTVPLATPFPFSHISWPLMSIPLFLHASRLGLATCCCRSKLPTAVPRSRSWALVLLLPFGVVRLTPCLPGPVKLIFQCYSNGSAQWGISGVCVCVCLLNCT